MIDAEKVEEIDSECTDHEDYHRRINDVAVRIAFFAALGYFVNDHNNVHLYMILIGCVIAFVEYIILTIDRVANQLVLRFGVNKLRNDCLVPTASFIFRQWFTDVNNTYFMKVVNTMLTISTWIFVPISWFIILSEMI